MKKYKLVKEYPGSLKLGTIFTQTVNHKGAYTANDGCRHIIAFGKDDGEYKNMFEEFSEFFEEMVENKIDMEKLIQMAKDAGVVPIDAEKQNESKMTLLFDINMLPSEYSIEGYEERFNVKLIPFDGSKVNIRGQMSGIGIQKI